MHLRRTAVLAVLLAALGARPAASQATGGALEGRVTDEQQRAVPNASVTARGDATAFERSVQSDALGGFTLRLPVGTYQVKVEAAGFAARVRAGVPVHLAGTTRVEVRLDLDVREEDVTVVGEAPLLDATESGVGEIVTRAQIENLPLNGRQFGNLAALVPGAGLGFHPDPTRSSQFAPLVSGGTGRNVNYQVDGGDNNDDTVGGLVQNFPLDAIAEFHFMTHRFRAEYGRSDGGVLSVVTRTGTNRLAGSAFGYLRDRSLNARTATEQDNGVPKGDYRRWQYGGSVGGPLRRDRTHFFASFERSQQDTTQAVGTQGIAPEKDGVYDVAYRESILAANVTHQLGAGRLLSLRYAFDHNVQPYGANPLAPPEAWGRNQNTFHSASIGLGSARPSRANDLLVHFAYFHNDIQASSSLPTETFPSGVRLGRNPFTPQDTLQAKYQLKDDFTWVRGGHQWKAGAAVIDVPRLDSTGSSDAAASFAHLADARSSPISRITIDGPVTDGGFVGSRLPNRQWGFYVQDAWRPIRRLGIDLGVRYDLVTGMAFDQDRNRVFADLQDAARAGRLAGIAGLEDFGHDMAEDTNNVAPRLGFALDAKGDGRLVVRGGLGRYYDLGYTNSYVLFPAADTQSSFGAVYLNQDSTGIRNADGSFYRVGQPLPPNQAVPDPANAATAVASPLVRQPYTDQANLGVSIAMGRLCAIEVDLVLARGRDLGRNLRLNTRPGLGPRRFASLLPRVGQVDFIVWTPRNESDYRGATIAFKRQWDRRLQLLASYTLSRAESTALNGTDAFAGAGLLDATDPFAEVQTAASATDARHRVSMSGLWSPGAGVLLSAVFRYRSPLPYNVVAGVDLNRDGVNYDLPPGVATLNSGRGARFSQLDVRLSKAFRVAGRTSVDVLVEGFNVLDARNPGAFVGNRRSALYGQPTTYAGDFKAGEQRIAQVGLRLAF